MREIPGAVWIGVGVWLTLAAIEGSILAVHDRVRPAEALLNPLLDYGLLALAAVAIWRVVAWTLAPGRSRSARVSAHALLAVAVFVPWKWLHVTLLGAILGPTSFSAGSTDWPWHLLTSALVYITATATIVVAQATRRLRARRERQARLELAAREAELRALKAQLRPHFLFNALNAVYAQVAEAPAAAQETIEQLAALLRRTLDACEAEEVPLSWELDTVATYLAIERVRFGEALQVSVDVPPALEGRLVPPLVLQPLVENAIKHGIGAAGRGRVAITARDRAGALVLTVEDSGAEPGKREPASLGSDSGGRGLALTRRRLEALYGRTATLSMASATPRGTRVRLQLPTAVAATS